jgi:RHS repeat-associated protein
LLSGYQTYDPYGNKLNSSDPIDSSLGYQSDYSDPAANLVWMGARWYSPELARFLTPDPVSGSPEDPLSLNLYPYCKGDPINRFDPTGMKSKDEGDYNWGNPWDWGRYLYDKAKEFVEGAVNLVVDIGKGIGKAAKYVATKVAQAAVKVARTVRKAYHAVYNESKWYHYKNLWHGATAGLKSYGGMIWGGLKGAYHLGTGLVSGIYNLATGKMTPGQFFGNMKKGAQQFWHNITNFKLAERDPFAYGEGIGENIITAETAAVAAWGLGSAVTGFVSGLKEGLASSGIGETLASEGGYIGVAGESVAAGASGAATAAEAETRVFYSGEGAQETAQAWAKTNNATTIDMTETGKAIKEFTGAPHNTYDATKLWKGPSGEFAAGASGDVHVFIGEGGAPPEGIWATVEHQALMENPNVTGIYEHQIGPGGNITTRYVPK